MRWQIYPALLIRTALASGMLLTVPGTGSAAQEPSSPVAMPPVTVTDEAPPSLTVPTEEAAQQEVERIPGAAEVIPKGAWKDTQATTLKDVLDYAPGVFIQPKWGEDSRLSIRGSGLSRNFHLRGIQLLQDGVPVNNSDGSSDFQEIDPTAFRYVEVFKGSNGLRYGGNSLGGAINFVTPTGHDAEMFEGRVDGGSFGFWRLQGSSGGAGEDLDGYVTGSWMGQDGFRDHSGGESRRASGNAGWRISKDAETRFYLNVADIEQEIPGSVTKSTALNEPRTPNPTNVTLNYQRNIESVRLANKTAVQFGGTTVEVGASAAYKHLIHPIFRYLDYGYYDFGGYGRLTDDRTLAGFANRLTLGVNSTGGWIDAEQYVNEPGGNKGALIQKTNDKAVTTVAYAENTFDILPELSLVAGMQYVYALRKREGEYPPTPDTSGSLTYSFFNPKGGIVWRVDPDWQVFGNVSRSGEAPTFGELNFTNAALSDTKAQRATTFEVGTRGKRADFSWDVSLYRSHLRNEFQFFDLGGGNYQVTNANDTIHQGVEAGFGWTFLKGVLATGPKTDEMVVNAAYTFSDFRFDDDPDWGDNELPGAPRHYLRGELLYKHPVGVYAGPNVEWVPQAYFVDNANTLKTRSYALLGFKAGYDVNDNVSLFIDGRNLTDEKYISSVGVTAVANPSSALFEPGAGRAFYGGIRLRW